MQHAERSGWLCVCGGVSVHLVLGCLYLWGNITTAVTSHLRIYDDSITYQDTLLVFATALGVQGCTMLLGGLVERRYGARTTVLAGGYTLTLGTFLSATATSLTEILFYDGVMFGVGMGLAYTAPITCASKWMPSRKGLVTGCIVAGFGFGAFVFGFLSSGILNPEGFDLPEGSAGGRGYFSPDSPVPSRVPRLFVTLGCCYFVLVSFAGWCLKEPSDAEEAEIAAAQLQLEELQLGGQHEKLSLNDPSSSPGTGMAVNPLLKSAYQAAAQSDSQHSNADADLEVSSFSPSSSSSSSSSFSSSSGAGAGAGASAGSGGGGSSGGSDDINKLAFDVGPTELVKNPLAWHLSSCLVLTTVGGMYLAGTYKTYGQGIFRSEVFLSTVGSLSSIFNAAGRIFWGACADRFGAIQTLTTLSLFFSLVIFTYSTSPSLGGEVGFALWTFLVFFFEGGNFALYPPITAGLFGVRNSGSNYGVIFMLYSACVVLNITTLAHYAVSFNTACQSMGILTLTGFLNLVLLQRHMRATCKRQE